MTKRLMLCLICLLCFSTVLASSEVIFPVAIDETVLTTSSTCDHIYQIPPNAIILREGWYSVNGLYHEYRKFYMASCIQEGCSSTAEFCVADQVSQHSWQYTGLDKHLKGQGLHSYIHRCPTCQATKDVSLDCPETGDCPVQIQIVETPLQLQ